MNLRADVLCRCCSIHLHGAAILHCLACRSHLVIEQQASCTVVWRVLDTRPHMLLDLLQEQITATGLRHMIYLHWCCQGSSAASGALGSGRERANRHIRRNTALEQGRIWCCTCSALRIRQTGGLTAIQ